ncbi:unnamed protein product, partial [marine sediment metagenome]
LVEEGSVSEEERVGYPHGRKQNGQQQLSRIAKRVLTGKVVPLVVGFPGSMSVRHIVPSLASYFRVTCYRGSDRSES